MAKKKLTKSDNQVEIRKSAMIEALKKSLGVVTTACNKVKISRETHYEWFNNDKEYKTRVLDIKDIAIDFVESKMFKAINNGDSSLMKYYMSTQGKQRGYGEKTEVEHSGIVKLKVGYGKRDDS